MRAITPCQGNLCVGFQDLPAPHNASFFLSMKSFSTSNPKPAFGLFPIQNRSVRPSLLPPFPRKRRSKRGRRRGGLVCTGILPMPDRSSDWLRLPPALRQQKHSPWALAGDVLSNRGPWARPLAPLPKPHHAAGPGRCPACPDLLDVQPRAPKDVPMAPAPAVLPQDIQGHSRHMAHADPMHPDFAQAPRHTADTGPMDSAEACSVWRLPLRRVGVAARHRPIGRVPLRGCVRRHRRARIHRRRRAIGGALASLRRFLIGRIRRILLRHPVRGYRRGPGTGSAPWDRADHSDGALTQEDIQFRLGRFVIRVDEQMPQPQAERAQEIPSQEGQVEHKEGTLFPAGEHGAELAGARPFELRIVRQQVFDKCILVQLG